MAAEAFDDLEKIADALAEIGKTLPFEEVALGVNKFIPATPMLEIQIVSFSLDLVGGGPGLSEQVNRFELVIYVPESGELETEERVLLKLAKQLVDALHEGDRTLGGLVEDVQVDDGQFSYLKVNASNYRALSILLNAGSIR